MFKNRKSIIISHVPIVFRLLGSAVNYYNYSDFRYFDLAIDCRLRLHVEANFALCIFAETRTYR